MAQASNGIENNGMIFIVFLPCVTIFLESSPISCQAGIQMSARVMEAPLIRSRKCEYQDSLDTINAIIVERLFNTYPLYELFCIDRRFVLARFESVDAPVTTGTSARAGSFETGDPVAHEQAAAPWDVVISPLSREFGSSNTYLAMPRVTLYREQFSGRTRIQGLAPPNTLAFALPVKCFEKSTWWKTPLHESGIPFLMSGGLDVDFSAGQEHIICLVDLEHLRSACPDRLLERVASASRQHVLPASDEAMRRLRGIIGSLLETAKNQPEVLQQRAAIQEMEQDFLDGFVQTISVMMPATKRGRQNERQRGLARVIELLRIENPTTVTVAQLCIKAHMSQRCLEYAFRETLGVSARGFLQLRRLHAARKDLLAGDSKTMRIFDIAHANGFYHMGRFSMRYKQCFGESPIQTLRRPCKIVQQSQLRFGG